MYEQCNTETEKPVTNSAHQ